MRRFLSRWYHRPFWLGVVLLGGVLAGRIALTPMVDEWARRQLAQLPNHHSTYRDLSLFSFPPTAVLTDVVVEDHDGNRVLTVPRLEVHMNWRDIRKGIAAGAWPYPAPTVSLRLVQPWLQVRSGHKAEIESKVREILAGSPAAHVEVAGIEHGRVSVARDRHGPPRDCTTDLRATFQNFTVGGAEPLAVDPNSREARTRARRLIGVDVDKLCAGAVKTVQVGPGSLSQAPAQPEGTSGLTAAAVTNW